MTAIGATQVTGLQGMTQIAATRSHNLARGQGILGKNLHVPTLLELP